jgi:succinate dehydrogenase hydrophobic anchor subunit
MLTKKKLPLLILMVICIELLIYFWAVWTTDHEFVFNKCARNSGRFSTGIILLALLMVGFYGLKKIFLEERKKGKLFNLDDTVFHQSFYPFIFCDHQF